MEVLLYPKDKIILYKNKENCCGCGACMNICPKHAIRMREDTAGFIYPEIDVNLCAKCGLCTNACRYQNEKEINRPMEAYAASVKNDKQILNSSSGGIFAALAEYVLEDGGVVFGSSLENISGKLTPRHIAIFEVKDLIKLQGSKYVQSYIGNTYQEAKEELILGKTVLFSGTPCQIAGLRGFLGKENYEKLITLDIICHGVPNALFFEDYIRVLENKMKGIVLNFTFRDKTNGWGMYVSKANFLTKKGKTKEKLIPKQISSYYKYFLNSDVNRDSCYSCKYASQHRAADVTIGDYWGIRKEHPELMKDEECLLTEKKGISCIIVNTIAGRKYLEKIEYKLNLYRSKFENVARGNNQLHTPSMKGKDREKVLELFSAKGYEEVEKYYRKQEGIKIYYNELKNIFATKIKK